MRSLADLMSLRGRVALITGAAGHIGTALAEALAELGAEVALWDLQAEKTEAAARQLEIRHGTAALGVAVDLASDAAVRESCEKTLNWRDGRLDILVHCAAFVGTSSLPGWATDFDNQSVDTWRKAVDVNLTVPFALTQMCAPALRKSGHGSVINVASIYGLVAPQYHLYAGTAMANPAAYAASKGGLLQLTRWLSSTLAPDIRVNAITPGGVERGQPDSFQQKYRAGTPLGRMATEEDFKGAVAYLASDLSAYVTGQNIVVDGGWTAC